MNENGQLLLYDALISILIIFIVIIAMFYVLNQEDEYSHNNNEAMDILNLLSSYSFNDKNILIKIEENDSTSKEIAEDILSIMYYMI